jgi:hypothetical protein
MPIIPTEQTSQGMLLFLKCGCAALSPFVRAELT